LFPCHSFTGAAGGPPIWFGGRSGGAVLGRTGRLGNGWLAYVVTADMYAAALTKIAWRKSV